MWSQGTHARAGVACADCHMPYQRVGAAKVSSHHVRSPMLAEAENSAGFHAPQEAARVLATSIALWAPEG